MPPPGGVGLAWALAAAVTAGLLSVLVPPQAMPPFVPATAASDALSALPRDLALVEPVAHAPWFGTWPTAVAALLAAASAGALWLAAWHLTTSAALAGAVVASMLVRPDLRMLVTLGAEPALALGAAWLAMAATRHEPAATRRLVRLALFVAAAAALWPPLAVTAPAFVAATAGLSWRATAVLLAGGGVGGIGGAARWAARASTLSAEPVSLTDALAVVVPATPRAMEAFVWAPMAEPLVPALLALAGLAVTIRRARTRSSAALGGLAIAAAWLLLPAWRAELLRAMLWTAWPLAAVAVHTVAAGPRWRQGLGAAAVLGVLIGGGIAPRPDARDETARATAAALGRLPAAPSVVGDDTRTDTALVAWGAGRGLRRVRPVAALVNAARADGAVFAGPTARRALERWGFTLGPRLAPPPAAALWPVTSRLGCLPVASPWRELPGLEFTGWLGLHVPAGEGRLEVAIVGAPPLAPRVTLDDGRRIGQVTAVPMTLTDLPPVLWPGDGRQPDASLHAFRVALPADGDAAYAASLALGRRAPLVAVRYVSSARRTDVATVCAAPLPGDAPGADGLDIGDDTFFAGGWHAVERDGAAVWRWSTGDAVMLVPAGTGGPVTLELTARSATDHPTDPIQLALSVNGWSAGPPRPLATTARGFQWAIPAGVWVAGTNEVVVATTRAVRPADGGGQDTRLLGAAISAFRVLPAP